MTDNDIIKALECCSKGAYAEVCEKCAFKNEDNKININCFNLEKYALELINRQKAEIERLQKNLSNLAASMEKCECSKIARIEAINEFAEMLKNDWIGNLYYCEDVDITDWIDTIAKEMVGDNE